MAFNSQLLAVPKASLDVLLLRPDPTSVSKEQVAELHNLLYAAITQCSTENLQTCRTWLTRNIAHSHGRLNAFGKYLVAISTSLQDNNADRQRIHLIFIAHDLLHHSQFHAERDYSAVKTAISPHIEALFSIASQGNRVRNGKHFARLHNIVKLWEQHEIFPADKLQALQRIVSGALPDVVMSNTGESRVRDQQMTEPPYILPQTHGHRSTPYYDLPAGNLLPHIQPHSTAPLNPTFIRPIEFRAGPADPGLVNAVRNFLKDVDNDDPSSAGANRDLTLPIDALGQTLVYDEVTGRLVPSENYYGWSVAFCERMRGNGRDRGRSRSRSRSPVRSHSRSQSRSSEYQERLQNTSSQSQSSPPPHSSNWNGSSNRPVQQNRHGFTNRSASRSRSRSPSAKRRRTSSYLPAGPHQPRPGPHFDNQYYQRGPQHGFVPPPMNSWSPPAGQHFNPPPPPFGAVLPRSADQSGQPWQGQYPAPNPYMMMGQAGTPIPPPPPPPPNYQGLWPPPPPGMPMPFPPPPPPPPPPGRTHRNQNRWQAGPNRRRR